MLLMRVIIFALLINDTFRQTKSNKDYSISWKW